MKDSNSLEQFKEFLALKEIEVYSRNQQLTGIKFNNRKYRFKTLAIDKEEIKQLANQKQNDKMMDKKQENNQKVKDPEKQKVEQQNKIIAEFNKQEKKKKRKQENEKTVLGEPKKESRQSKKRLQEIQKIKDSKLRNKEISKPERQTSETKYRLGYNPEENKKAFDGGKNNEKQRKEDIETSRKQGNGNTKQDKEIE